MGAGAPRRAAGRPGAPPRASRRVFVPAGRRSSVCLLAFLLAVGVCLLRLPEPWDPPAPSSSSSSSTAEEPNRTVTLLIWTHPFGRRRELPDCRALYQVSGCALTDEWSAYPRADAVLVHHREVASGAVDLPPEPRPPAQTWIWMNYESPTHTRGLRRLEGRFNLTMSYRTDSDIFLPYGYLTPGARPRSNGRARPLGEPSPSPSRARLRRPRLLAWVVSNWSESHARVAFYYRLRAHIQVDVFGRAGRKLPEDAGGSGSVVRLLGRYQFYLALENSQHTDYVTEKLWNAVAAGAVPVVLGPSRRNYERFLPPEAFIHAEDFPTPRGLARYLLALWRDPARLLRHLAWRGRYSVHQPAFWAEHYCAACRAVGRRGRGGGRGQVVHDLTSWFLS